MAADEVPTAHLRHSRRLPVLCAPRRPANDAEQETDGFKVDPDPLQWHTSRLLDLAVYNGASMGSDTIQSLTS